MTPTEEGKLRATSRLADRDSLRREVLAASDRAIKFLSRKDMLTEPSMYLANICVELDAHFGVGTTLCLDWMLGRYAAMEFERRVHPWFVEIWEALRAGGHTYRTQFDYFDAEAFYVPHPSRKVVVMGSWWKYGGTKVVAIDDMDADSLFGGKFYVRRIWQKTKVDSVRTVARPTLSFYRGRQFDMKFTDTPRLYGDHRDPGHVMTYEKMFGDAKCDQAIWDLHKPLRWFFEVNCLWTGLVGSPEVSR